MTYLILAPFGLIIGSFLNVCIYRMQRDQSVNDPPRSRCPHCGRMLAWYDNIPVFSFIWLRAKCRYCRKKISFRYPLVELLTMVLLLELVRRWPDMIAWPAAAFAASSILLVIAFIDWDTFLIPDILSVGLIVLGLVASPINPLLGPTIGWRVAASAAGAVGWFLIMWGIAVIGEWACGQEALGGGDIKLLAAVGAWSGLLGGFDCIMAGSMLGVLYIIPHVIRRRLGRKDPIPFGPFLSAAAILNFFYLMPFGFPFM